MGLWTAQRQIASIMQVLQRLMPLQKAENAYFATDLGVVSSDVRAKLRGLQTRLYFDWESIDHRPFEALPANAELDAPRQLSFINLPEPSSQELLFGDEFLQHFEASSAQTDWRDLEDGIKDSLENAPAPNVSLTDTSSTQPLPVASKVSKPPRPRQSSIQPGSTRHALPAAVSGQFPNTSPAQASTEVLEAILLDNTPNPNDLVRKYLKPGEAPQVLHDPLVEDAIYADPLAWLEGDNATGDDPLSAECSLPLWAQDVSAQKFSAQEASAPTQVPQNSPETEVPEPRVAQAAASTSEHDVAATQPAAQQPERRLFGLIPLMPMKPISLFRTSQPASKTLEPPKGLDDLFPHPITSFFNESSPAPTVAASNAPAVMPQPEPVVSTGADDIEPLMPQSTPAQKFSVVSTAIANGTSRFRKIGTPNTPTELSQNAQATSPAATSAMLQATSPVIDWDTGLVMSQPEASLAQACYTTANAQALNSKLSQQARVASVHNFTDAEPAEVDDRYTYMLRRTQFLANSIDRLASEYFARSGQHAGPHSVQRSGASAG